MMPLSSPAIFETFTHFISFIHSCTSRRSWNEAGS